MTDSDKLVKPEVRQQYFTQREVAAMMGTSERTVKKWIDAGHLPTHTIGRRQKVFIDDLHRAIKNGQLRD